MGGAQVFAWVVVDFHFPFFSGVSIPHTMNIGFEDINTKRLFITVFFSPKSLEL